MLKVKELLPVFPEETIQKRISELGEQIARDYQGEEVICVCVLKGAVFFFTDIVRAIGRHLDGITIDFLRASSYGSGTSSSCVVNISKDVDTDIKGKNVLFIEDVIDSGLTMSKVMGMFKERGAKSVKLCACVDKKECREVDIHIDYSAFTVDKGFIVGYGLDLAEKYRELPGIYEAVVEEV